MLSLAALLVAAAIGQDVPAWDAGPVVAIEDDPDAWKLGKQLDAEQEKYERVQKQKAVAKKAHTAPVVHRATIGRPTPMR